MKILYKIIFSLFLLYSYSLNAQTTINGGAVNGTWTKAKSPYKITADIRIDAGDTLIIEPGVKVEFNNNVGVFVRGQILANGAIGDSIVFTVNPISNYHNLWQTTQYGWRGFCFLGDLADTDTTEFSYCTFSYTNKLDTTGCHFRGTAIGFDNDSLMFIANTTSIASFAHRVYKVESCRFFNQLGASGTINMRKGGLRLTQCSFNNIIPEDLHGASLVNHSGLVLNDRSTFPRPTKYYYHYISDNSFVNMHGVVFLINAARKVVFRNTNVSELHAYNTKTINDTLFALGYFGSEMDLDSFVFENSSDSFFYDPQNALLDIYGKMTVFRKIYIRNITIKNLYSQGTKIIRKDLINYRAGTVARLENFNVHNFKKIYTSNYSSKSPRITNCISITNGNELEVHNFKITSSSGGVENSGDLTLQNGIIANCDGVGINSGGGGYLRASNILIAYNNNYGFLTGSGQGGVKANSYFSNCIITGNRGDNWPSGGQVSYDDQSFITFKNCIIENGKPGFKFTNNFNQTNYKADTINCFSSAPTFENPTAGAGENYDALAADWHLKSACGVDPLGINAGTDTLVNYKFAFTNWGFELPALDLDGKDRKHCGIVDIGPYETTTIKEGIIKPELIDSFTACVGDTLYSILSPMICTDDNSTYQWQEKSAGGVFTDISGATESSLNLKNINTNSNKSLFRLKISNSSCNTTRYSDSSQLVVKESPKFTLPKDTSVCSNEEITLNAGSTLLNQKWNDNDTNRLKTFNGKANSTWSITAESEDGCTGKHTLNIESLPAPTIDLGKDTSLDNRETLQLGVGNSFMSYLWEDNSTNSTKDVGGDTNLIGAKEFWLEVKSTNGCIGRDSITVTFKKLVSVSDIKLNEFSVYPNPSFGKFQVHIPQDGTLMIFSQTGQLIVKMTLKKGNWQISHDSIEKGMYYMIYQSHEESQTELIHIK